MLVVAALEFSHPVLLVVLVKADDLSVYRHRYSIGVSLATLKASHFMP